MPAIDRYLGIALSVLGSLVLWTSRGFPDVPGQKFGAATLPTIVAAGLVVCGLLLIRRGMGADRAGQAPEAVREALPAERLGPAIGVLASIALYLFASEPLGYLLTAPVCLLIALVSLRVRVLTALVWSIVAALAVHLAFYKLLKVPLPWGILPPLY